VLRPPVVLAARTTPPLREETGEVDLQTGAKRVGGLHAGTSSVV